MTLKLRYFGAPLALVAIAFASHVSSSNHADIAFAAGDCTVADQTLDTEEREFARLINEYRAANNLSALTVSVYLSKEASWHAKDMADKNYFSHTDSLGRSPEQRGLDCGTKTGIGENIAAGTVRDTAQEAFDAWKASSGHNANMLASGYKQIGIARYFNASSTYDWYWVTDFSLNSDGTNMLSGGSSPSATATRTPTKTATRTPTKTATRSATRTPTPALSSTATRTPTRTATPTTTPVSSAPSGGSTATMQSPQPGTVLNGTSVTFSWNSVSGATAYRIWVGTSPGTSNIASVSTGTVTSATVSNLPSGSQTVYVRLFTKTATSNYVDYTYTSAP